MRRLLIAVFASLLGVALIASAAQAKTQERYFQDLDPSDHSHVFHSQVFITVDFKDRHGNKRFTPRSIAYYHFATQAICTLPTPAALPGLDFHGPGEPALTVTKGKGKFYYDLANSAGSGQSITGYLRGKVIKTSKRFRVDGSLDVQDFDVPPTVLNCATPGVITYAATPCRNPNADSSLPPCFPNY